MTEKEWLDDNQLSLDIWHKKYQINGESFEEWLNRVSGGNSEVKRLIREKKFLFGGRILANRGTNRGAMSNCNSLGFIEDSLVDIMQANTDLALTYKAQGGQGLSLSKLRPKGTLIHSNFPSDGIVPFMEMFNTTTKSISQGGNRRGALLMALDIWHKEALDFIKIKSNLQSINNANLSLEIDNTFMSIIDNYYKTGEKPIVHIKREYNGNTIEYDVNPVELYKELCDYARRYAEPGILFVDRMKHYNMAQYHSTYRIESTNACSEIPMTKHGACILGSINLGAYVNNPYTSRAEIDYKSLLEDIDTIVAAMDDIVTENQPKHILKGQAEVAKTYRNVGIGIMGLNDLLVKKGFRYGEPEAIALSGYIMKSIFRRCVIKSSFLGKIRGNFPGYEPNIWDTDIIRSNFTDKEINSLKKSNSLRNLSLVSIAPAGSIGTMLGVSTGCEPYFSLSYYRRTVSLDGDKEHLYKVDIDAIQDYKNITGNTDVPEYFVGANDIPWKERIDMQAELQNYVDQAISSTVNLPKGTTSEDIEQLYLYAWKQGLKGVTIFVDGSRDPILSKDVKPKSIPTTGAPKRPKELPCDIHKVKVNKENFIVCVGLYEDKPYEVFVFRLKHNVLINDNKGTITKESKGVYSLDTAELKIANLLNTDISVEEKAATLYSSMLLRHGVNIKYIIKTAKKVNNNITSFSSAMCRVLAKYIPVTTEGKCPECGKDLIYSGGCISCPSCGYSKCE